VSLLLDRVVDVVSLGQFPHVIVHVYQSSSDIGFDHDLFKLTHFDQAVNVKLNPNRLLQKLVYFVIAVNNLVLEHEGTEGLHRCFLSHIGVDLSPPLLGDLEEFVKSSVWKLEVDRLFLQLELVRNDIADLILDILCLLCGVFEDHLGLMAVVEELMNIGLLWFTERLEDGVFGRIALYELMVFHHLNLHILLPNSTRTQRLFLLLPPLVCSIRVFCKIDILACHGLHHLFEYEIALLTIDFLEVDVKLLALSYHGQFYWLFYLAVVGDFVRIDDVLLEK
jgi:hypothetical protein